VDSVTRQGHHFRLQEGSLAIWPRCASTSGCTHLLHFVCSAEIHAKESVARARISAARDDSSSCSPPVPDSPLIALLNHLW